MDEDLLFDHLYEDLFDESSDDSTRTEIHKAVRTRNVERVRQLLKENPECSNEWDDKFRTPLHAVFDFVDPAVQNRKVRLIVQLLLEHGSDVNASWGRDYVTPLLLAIHRFQKKVIKLLLSSGADPKKCPRCLVHAVYGLKHESLVKLLMRRGADPKELFFRRLYHKTNDTHVYSMLLDLGNKIHYIYDMIKVASTLLENDVIIFLLNHSDHFNPRGRFSLGELMIYIFLHPGRGFFGLLNDILREWGYPVERPLNNRGNHILHHYMELKEYDAVKVIIQTGYDINLRNGDGDTTLHLLFRQNGNERSSRTNELVRFFLSHGAEINIHNRFNQTPFSLAVVYDYREEIVIMLANITGLEESDLGTYKEEFSTVSKDMHHKVPIDKYSFELYAAIYLDYDEVVDRLVDMGCNRRNSFYINYAITHKRYKIAKILYEADFKGLQKAYPYKVPEYTNRKRDKERLLTLVWAFDKPSVLKIPVTYNLRWYQTFGFLREIEMNIFFHVLELDLVKPNYTYEQLKKLNYLISDPFEVIDRLKNIVFLTNESTMYDVLMMDFNCLVSALYDPDNLEICLDFCKTIQDKYHNLPVSSFSTRDESAEVIECHEIILLEKLSLAIERRRIWNRAADTLNLYIKSTLRSLNYNNLPEEITWKIFSFLRVRDVRNFRLEVRHSRRKVSRKKRIINFLRRPLFRRNSTMGINRPFSR